MKSRITIHTAPNYLPCIKVSEGQDESDDVRDQLVRGFRECLKHKSNTVQLIFQDSNSEYILFPVEDELSYFQNHVLNKYLSDPASRKALLCIASLINREINMEEVDREISEAVDKLVKKGATNIKVTLL